MPARSPYEVSPLEQRMGLGQAADLPQQQQFIGPNPYEALATPRTAGDMRRDAFTNPAAPQQFLSERNPYTMRERLREGAEMLASAFGMDERQAYSVARGLIGDPSHSETAQPGVLDMTPLGSLMGMQEGAQQVGAGETGAGALNMGLGALDFVPGAGEAATGLGKMMAPLGAMAAGVGPKGGLRAYHGSAADFDGFSDAARGTGDGQQAFGPGHYFTESDDLAKDYRDRLASRDGTKGRLYEVDIKAGQEQMLDWDKPFNEQPAAVQGALRDVVAQTPPDGGFGGRSAVRQGPLQDALLDLAERNLDSLGHLTPSRMVDKFIDTPGWQEKYGASDELAALVDNHVTKDRMAAFIRKDPERAMDLLRQAGVPGITYRDNVSQAAKDNPRNYVVFDAKTIEIVRKYGLAGLFAGGAAAAMLGGDEAEAAPLSPGG
jgi:hypothetical protein